MATGPSYVLAVLKIGDRDAAYLADRVQRAAIGTTAGTSQGQKLGRKAANALSSLLSRVAGGVAPGNLWMTVVDDTGTKPSATIACTQANASGNTVTFTYGGKAIVLTEAVDFARGASDTTCAANLATAINAHPVLGNIMTATGNVGDCELDAKFPSAIMHDLVITTDDATAFGITDFASGTEGAAQWFLQHFWLNKSA